MTHPTAACAVDPEVLAVARGDAPAELALEGGRVANVFTGAIVPGTVLIARGRVAAVLPAGEAFDAREGADLGGSVVAPGLIDAHMHVESTMLPPSRFGLLAAARGTTAVVADPHEIANVLGLAGVRWMLADASRAPVRIYFTASSCVPSCHLENSGATLAAADLEPLFTGEGVRDRVVGLAEMMNFPGAAMGDAGVVEKIRLGLAHGVVDGHCPGLRGRMLAAYAAAGISSDHESVAADEAREKLAAGLRVYIREGSAARNLDALLPIVTDATYHRVSLCTDDRHPDDLARDGHIDHAVRRAIAGGLDPVRALTIASITTATHYGLRAATGPERGAPVGAVAPGYAADLIVFDDPERPEPRMAFVGGRVVAEGGVAVDAASALAEAPPSGVALPEGFGTGSFRAPAPTGAGGSARARVIGMDPAQLVTEPLEMDLPVAGGAFIADPGRDVLKIAVVERHGGAGGVGVGFVRGFGFRGGALASTVAHDAHNLVVVGDDDGAMAAACRELARVGGGQTVVAGAGDSAEVRATLPLPIAGLMSDQEPAEVIARQAALLDAAASLGGPHRDPFMPLSFMALPVIPALKISDLGLVDVLRFEVTPLAV